MSLTEQRNRFLSFAFASSDVLIETDRDGKVSYAAGAVATLGTPELEGKGEDLAQRLDRTSRPVFMALCKRVRPGRRLGPSRVTVNGRAAKLSGWTLGNDEQVCWSLSFDSAHQPEELDPQAFERAAEKSIAEAREAGVKMAMSVMRIECDDEIERLIGEEQAERLFQSIAASCANAVGSTGVARQIDGRRTALIHDRKCDLAKLAKEVDQTLADFSIDPGRARIESVADSPDLDPATAVQAFIHAVNEAADSEAVLDIASLHEVADRLMAETQRRMQELRTTIAGRVIEPYAQPIIDLKTGKVHHYELLLRLPGGKPVEESVGFAESTGIIYEIDYAMTEIAAAFLREDYDRPALAVNLSGRSLTNINWGKRFLKLLADLKIDRKRLSFELTETASVKNTTAANKILDKIRERGHKVCLDDFGAGAAGFHYLRDFPADIVKIDGAYVRNVKRSERDTILLTGMIDLCKKLGAETVAEMIETEQQAKLMASMGITYGQGYYFGKPVPLKMLADPKFSANRAA
ncbi:EAL domain-containing protein [Maricaulis sp. CAU 1757]